MRAAGASHFWGAYHAHPRRAGSRQRPWAVEGGVYGFPTGVPEGNVRAAEGFGGLFPLLAVVEPCVLADGGDVRSGDDDGPTGTGDGQQAVADRTWQRGVARRLAAREPSFFTDDGCTSSDGDDLGTESDSADGGARAGRLVRRLCAGPRGAADRALQRDVILAAARAPSFVPGDGCVLRERGGAVGAGTSSARRSRKRAGDTVRLCRRADGSEVRAGGELVKRRRVWGAEASLFGAGRCEAAGLRVAAVAGSDLAAQRLSLWSRGVVLCGARWRLWALAPGGRRSRSARPSPVVSAVVVGEPSVQRLYSGIRARLRGRLAGTQRWSHGGMQQSWSDAERTAELSSGAHDCRSDRWSLIVRERTALQAATERLFLACLLHDRLEWGALGLDVDTAACVAGCIGCPEVDVSYRGQPFGDGGALHYIGTLGGTTPWLNPHSAGLVSAGMSTLGDPHCDPVRLVDRHTDRGSDVRASSTYRGYPTRHRHHHHCTVGHNRTAVVLPCTVGCTDPLSAGYLAATSWVGVDLGPYRRLRCSHYCVRHCSESARRLVSAAGGTPYGLLRNWELQGRRDRGVGRGVDGTLNETRRAGGGWVTLRRHVDDASLRWGPGNVAAFEVTEHTHTAFRSFRLVMIGANAHGTEALYCGGLELYGALVDGVDYDATVRAEGGVTGDRFRDAVRVKGDSRSLGRARVFDRARGLRWPQDGRFVGEGLVGLRHTARGWRYGWHTRSPTWWLDHGTMLRNNLRDLRTELGDAVYFARDGLRLRAVAGADAWIRGSAHLAGHTRLTDFAGCMGSRRQRLGLAWREAGAGWRAARLGSVWDTAAGELRADYEIVACDGALARARRRAIRADIGEFSVPAEGYGRAGLGCPRGAFAGWCPRVGDAVRYHGAVARVVGVCRGGVRVQRHDGAEEDCGLSRVRRISLGVWRACHGPDGPDTQFQYDDFVRHGFGRVTAAGFHPLRAVVPTTAVVTWRDQYTVPAPGDHPAASPGRRVTCRLDDSEPADDTGLQSVASGSADSVVDRGYLVPVRADICTRPDIGAEFVLGTELAPSACGVGAASARGYRVCSQTRAPGARVWRPAGPGVRFFLLFRDAVVVQRYFDIAARALGIAFSRGHAGVCVINEHGMIGRGVGLHRSVELLTGTAVPLRGGWAHREVYAITDVQAAVESLRCVAAAHRARSAPAVPRDVRGSASYCGGWGVDGFRVFERPVRGGGCGGGLCAALPAVRHRPGRDRFVRGPPRLARRACPVVWEPPIARALHGVLRIHCAVTDAVLATAISCALPLHAVF